MKLGTRLAMAFSTMTITPTLLFCLLVPAFNNYQTRSSTKEYGLTEQADLFSGNSMQVFNRVTKRSQEDIRNILDNDPGLYNDLSYLDKVNAELGSRYVYLIVRKGDTIPYCGDSNKDAEEVICAQLPQLSTMRGDLQGDAYLDGESQHLIKQMNFTSPDGQKGDALIISNMNDLVSEVKSMIRGVLTLGVIILVFAGTVLTFWVYRSILSPLSKLQEATRKIRDGNLDSTLDMGTDDKIGQLCQDFEKMCIRLKENAEGRIQYNEDNKELISSVSHDLKTPIMTIEGCAEDIPDGVVSPPEELDKYIRTIHNKSGGMDRLIDKLTFYSKIGTNRIPYTFSKIDVAQYFWDCVEEAGLDMEARGTELGYFNYVGEDVAIIAGAKQMERVMNNIISSSVKYLDKRKGIINIRIGDVGGFIQIGIEDNGKDIAAGDLPNISDRFYRTDSSHDSAQGGSGVGSSTARKIMKGYRGCIWATSKEEIGTEVHFALGKYQEVLQGKQNSNCGR